MKTELPNGRGETVLVVEDDEGVRELVEMHLRALGYRSLSAADGPSALALLRTGAVIELLFTDLSLPGGMNGREVAEAARKIAPGLKVLYTSGYSDAACEGGMVPGAIVLGKPWRREDLARKVHEALGQA